METAGLCAEKGMLMEKAINKMLLKHLLDDVRPCKSGNWDRYLAGALTIANTWRQHWLWVRVPSALYSNGRNLAG